MENDPLNIGEFFNCYNEAPKGFYFVSQDSLYKKCYYTCETCNMGGDIEFHNCLQCNTEFDFEININLYINCYKKCKYYYYFDNNNYYNCTKNLICPSE